jgi:hypothetical protein
VNDGKYADMDMQKLSKAGELNDEQKVSEMQLGP